MKRVLLAMVLLLGAPLAWAAGVVHSAAGRAWIEGSGTILPVQEGVAVAEGAIPPLDTALTGVAWFGAINEVVARWLLVDDAPPLETTYPALRAILLRSVGAPVG